MDDRKENELATTNLGDSGYEIFRKNSDGELKSIFKSKEQ
jgi:hypothetical protein